MGVDVDGCDFLDVGQFQLGHFVFPGGSASGK
jgi:hypothetical protein